ncbi:hypothetical protein ACIBG7_18645 [Nonomuraea sp. NPDC050328]|uniref:hypothetical protein n=1 Tax=Nonomuraea sp. NPDC050328 TaxID=3364361 RepID=UPI0037B9EA6A
MHPQQPRQATQVYTQQYTQAPGQAPTQVQPPMGPPPGWQPAPMPPQPQAKRGMPKGLIIGLIVAGVIAAGGLVKLLDPSGPATTSTASSVPQPDDAQARELRAALGEIDPALDHERSISRARDTCQQILAGMERTRVAAAVQKRFSGTATVGAADARRIVELIESSAWCR